MSEISNPQTISEITENSEMGNEQDTGGKASELTIHTVGEVSEAEGFDEAVPYDRNSLESENNDVNDDSSENESSKETAESAEDIDKVDVGDDYRYSGWEINTDPVEISEGTLACLALFSSDHWDSLGTKERTDAMEMLADHLAADLGVRFKPNVRFYDTLTPYDYGEYRTQRNTIYINTENTGGGEMAAGIIAYEVRRCWQCEKANNPQCLRDQVFRDNLDHYIRPVDGMPAFRNQPVERDARAYAKGVADYV